MHAPSALAGLVVVVQLEDIVRADLDPARRRHVVHCVCVCVLVRLSEIHANDHVLYH
jgi:hypothetical protein